MARVLKNMDRLLAMREKRGKPKIVLSFVVYDHNYQELAGFLDMAQQRRVDKVVVRFFKPTEEMRDLFFSKEALAALTRRPLRRHCRRRMILSMTLKECMISFPTGNYSTMWFQCRIRRCTMTGCYFMIRRAGASIAM